MTDDAKALLEGTTPGPWRQMPADNWMVENDELGYLSWTAVGADEPHVIVMTGEPGDERVDANARLIAAAPDLARQVITLTTRAETAEEFAAKADLSRLAYARGLKKLMDAVSSAVIEIEDEGDRVYFGSTNHADDLRAAWQLADALELEELFEDTQPQTSLAETNLQLQQRAETAEAEVKRLREGNYHVKQAANYIARNAAETTDKDLTSARHHIAKLAALLKEQGE